jgi:hypothetical protein
VFLTAFVGLSGVDDDLHKVGIEDHAVNVAGIKSDEVFILLFHFLQMSGDFGSFPVKLLPADLVGLK